MIPSNQQQLPIIITFKIASMPPYTLHPSWSQQMSNGITSLILLFSYCQCRSNSNCSHSSEKRAHFNTSLYWWWYQLNQIRKKINPNKRSDRGPPFLQPVRHQNRFCFVFEYDLLNIVNRCRIFGRRHQTLTGDKIIFSRTPLYLVFSVPSALISTFT